MMVILARIVATGFVFAAAYLFIYWVPFSIIEIAERRLVAGIVSPPCAIAAAWFVWTRLGSANPGLITSAATGALVVGGVAFAAGFFGPIIFAPGANQGPLLGLFITGPLGFIVGLLGGIVYWLVVGRRSAATATGDGSQARDSG